MKNSLTVGKILKKYCLTESFINFTFTGMLYSTKKKILGVQHCGEATFIILPNRVRIKIDWYRFRPKNENAIVTNQNTVTIDQKPVSTLTF